MTRSISPLLLALALLSPLRAQDRRIVPISVNRKQALVIGNSDYSQAPLKNPKNDATAMEATLHKLNFDVKVVRDADLAQMEQAIDDFTAGLEPGSLAFFYYSGHGIQVNSDNYLLPVDFKAQSAADVKYKAYPASRVQDKMEASGARLRIMVLDACRNNPFHYKRDSSGGLAPMSTDAEGTLIAFATSDGMTADDNAADRNGLYTKYLIGALLTPGLQLRETFQKAKEDVYAASRHSQNPAIYDNIAGRFALIPGPDPAQRAYDLAKSRNSRDLFEALIGEYPGSDYARMARIDLERIAKEEQLRQAQADQARLRKEDDDFWNTVKVSTDPAMIDGYISRFPKGWHVDEARKQRAVLVAALNKASKLDTSKAFQIADDTAFGIARTSNTVAGIQSYLDQFPNGSHVDEARKLRDDIAARDSTAEAQRKLREFKREDDKAWDFARSGNSKESLNKYLTEYGTTGFHVAEARDFLAKLPDRPERGAIVIPEVGKVYFNPKDNLEYMWVPPGTFEAGCKSDCGKDDPRPHQVTLPGFWIGQSEVPVRAYKVGFAEKARRKMPKHEPMENKHWMITDHPMIMESWEDANAYCEWAGGHLPSGDEWERAARGGRDTAYPWGDQFDKDKAKYSGSPKVTGADTTAVKSYPPNDYGIHDMSGNVWEWTTDGVKGVHLTRGGGWYSAPRDLRVTSVRGFRDEGSNEVGFRCVLPQLEK